MVNHGIAKTLSSHEESSPYHHNGNDRYKYSKGQSSLSSSASSLLTSGATRGGKGSGNGSLLLKFPFVACLVAVATLYILVQDANRHVFERDFQVIANKVQDAFFYETHMKTYAVHDATLTASNLIVAQGINVKKETKRLVSAMHDADLLQLFQDRNTAMRHFARIDSLTWHPIDSLTKARKKHAKQQQQQQRRENRAGSLTCETERTCRGGKIRGQAIQVIEESRSPVTSEAWVRAGEDTKEIKSTIFYPVSVPVKGAGTSQEEELIGAVAADIKWADFFSPVTFESDNEGLVIAVENTLGQGFTFRVKNGRLTFVGGGFLYDDDFEGMMVISDYADFVKPGLSKILHSKRPGTEDWFCGCEYRLRIYPSAEMYEIYASSWPQMFFMGAILSIFTLFLSFLAYDIYVTRRYYNVSEDLTRYNSIVGSLFPDVVLDRVVDESMSLKKKNSGPYSSALTPTLDKYDTNEMVFSNKYLADYDFPVEVMSGTVTEQPIYNSFPHTTVCFMDISGFTSWSSERDPEQVFRLLETTYQMFDQIANRLNVFKIETIGDSYVCVTGCPEFQKDHCLVMVRFAYEAMVSFIHLVKSLEVSLGPGTADLAIRTGIHSGPVIAGVIRAEKFRFQLFGDTMNTASRMESTGKPGMIHLSRDSAALLEAAGKCNWLETREDVVPVKGKGAMTTYWVKVSPEKAGLNISSIVSANWGNDTHLQGTESLASKRQLIDWNTEVLLDFLRKVVARRKALEQRYGMKRAQDSNTGRDNSTVEYKKYVAQRSLMDHVAEVIPFASYEEELEEEDPSQINLGPTVEAQARAYVEECASLYNDVSFHNFDHASHVVMSANKLLGRIITPDKGGFQQLERNAKGGTKKSREFHDKTYGISCDPLMHFATIQAALIHDVAHQGVTNKQLAEKDKEMAARYNGRSVAEQHSLVLSMHVFADDKYRDLREALLANDPKETKRYYQFMISSVLATDIADKEFKEIRQKRWDDLFEAEKNAKQARQRLSLDSFYLGELDRVDWHVRIVAVCSAITWLVLVYIAYSATPEANHEVLVGVEQKAAGVAFTLLACSYVLKVVPHLIKVFDCKAQPMSGVIIGVITIQTIALITDGLMACGFKTPVMIDPVVGTRVHLLRWCEWSSLAFCIYFITDGADVPDKEVGLKAKYFFAGCQGVSTLAGFLFPFAPNAIVWGILCFFSTILFLPLYPHIYYKRKVFNCLERGLSADDKEIYDRSYYSLHFLETLGVTWGLMVSTFFLEAFGPKISSFLDFTRADGFSVIWTSIFDCVSKMRYMNLIMDIHTLVFDTRARAERQKAESIRLKEVANKKATILFEYIIQASDVAHCMQHWGIYQKYNRRLFEEQFKAYLNGDSNDDPRPGWFKGEIWFFENYVIPLAQKLCDSGCFGVSGYEYLRSATSNLAEWKLKGEQITADMIAEYEAKLMGKSRDDVNSSDNAKSSDTAETDSETYSVNSHSEMEIKIDDSLRSFGPLAPLFGFPPSFGQQHQFQQKSKK